MFDPSKPIIKRYMIMNTTETAIHCFEKAGLGKAGFRCTGVVSIPSASLAERNPDAYNNAMAMLPRNLGIGSCAYCGTAIMHNFIIESADGKRFVVGSDCVARTGDAGLAKEVKRERVMARKVIRDAKRNLAKAEREAAWKAERAERAAIFTVEHAALIARAEPFMHSDFIKSVIGRGIDGGYVSEKALNAVTNAITAIEENIRMRENSRHVGTVGKRETFNVRVHRINSYSRPSFAGYGHETVWIVTLRDANDNAIVVKSPAFCPEKGETLTIKATVKAHDEYKGEKQTIVQRVKVA